MKPTDKATYAIKMQRRTAALKWSGKLQDEPVTVERPKPQPIFSKDEWNAEVRRRRNASVSSLLSAHLFSGLAFGAMLRGTAKRKGRK